MLQKFYSRISLKTKGIGWRIYSFKHYNGFTDFMYRFGGWKHICEQLNEACYVPIYDIRDYIKKLNHR